jgi:hypothetical protein
LSKPIALLIALALPAVSFAEVVWSSDFESRDFSERGTPRNGQSLAPSGWYRVQAVSPESVRFVWDPVRQGLVAQITVNQGDFVSSGTRAELVKMTHEAAGSEYFYRWSVMFAPNYPSSEKWQLFTQWHHDGPSGSPPLEMYVNGERMYLRAGGTNGDVLWSKPLQRGVWQDFILHVKWSPDPTQGFVELYRNGERELEPKAAPTMFDGQRNYLKMGLYRSAEIPEQGVVYFDDVKMATTLADVLPPRAPNSSASEGPRDPSAAFQNVELGPSGAGCAAGGGVVPAAVAVAFLAVVAAVRKRKPLHVAARARSRR